MTMLARASGIPARLVTGYRVAEWSPVTREYVVREKNAHAWVEAWVNGGWRTYNPTPMLELPQDRSHLASSGDARGRLHPSGRARHRVCHFTRDAGAALRSARRPCLPLGRSALGPPARRLPGAKSERRRGGPSAPVLRVARVVPRATGAPPRRIRAAGAVRAAPPWVRLPRSGGARGAVRGAALRRTRGSNRARTRCRALRRGGPLDVYVPLASCSITPGTSPSSVSRAAHLSAPARRARGAGASGCERWGDSRSPARAPGEVGRGARADSRGTSRAGISSYRSAWSSGRSASR